MLSRRQEIARLFFTYKSNDMKNTDDAGYALTMILMIVLALGSLAGLLA